MDQPISKVKEFLTDDERKEGQLTKRIEKQTARIPSSGFLALAIGSMAVSIGLELFATRRREPGTFVGLWVPTLLLFGIYNKIVKTSGSDRDEHLRAA
jgi:hypothetical protein